MNKNWPGKTVYSAESIGKEAPIELLRLALSSPHPGEIIPCLEEKTVHPDIEIREITSRLRYRGPKPHPLADKKDSRGLAEYGLFAKRHIPKNMFLGEYTGEVRLIHWKSAEKEAGASYNWISYFHPYFWCIDSNRISNEMMYVNDYRGLQGAPNASFSRAAHRSVYYFGYATLRDIEPDEEIVADYGKEWEDLYTQMHSKVGNMPRRRPQFAPGIAGAGVPEDASSWGWGAGGCKMSGCPTSAETNF